MSSLPLPHVSVITPAFQAAATIAHTIQSVQAQDFLDWEMIIIDDNSNDGTAAIAAHFAANDARIRVIQRATNGGSAASRNQGLQAAKGRYVAFLDADDLWLPHKLSRQMAFMQEQNCTYSCHAYRRMHPNGKLGRILRSPARVTFDTLLHQTPVGTLTVMIDYDAVGRSVSFPTTIPFCEDLALWLLVTKAGHDIVFLNEDLARYRINPMGKSSRLLRNQWDVACAYRRYGGLTRGQTFQAMLHHALHGLWKRIF